MTARRQSSRRPRAGDSVFVRSVPGSVGTLPRVSRRAFKLAVGHQFKVLGQNRAGWLELNIGRVADTILGGIMNTIWIEPKSSAGILSPSTTGRRPLTRKAGQDHSALPMRLHRGARF